MKKEEGLRGKDNKLRIAKDHPLKKRARMVEGMAIKNHIDDIKFQFWQLF